MARTATATAPTVRSTAKPAPRATPRPAARKAKAVPKQASPAAKPPAKPAAAPAAPAPKALKLVRDSFTMPQQDFELIATLKQRAIVLQRPVKKSELLRAGLQALQRLPDDALMASLQALLPIKTGRPKKG